MSQYLFLFSIGPVQSFIAQARKTQDLYAGSSILSDLLNFALGYAKTVNAEIIFPYFDKNYYTFDIEQNEDSYPNRFVVLLNMDTEGVKIFGQTVENLVKGKLLDAAKTKISPAIPAQDMPLGICEQIQNFLDIYWVAIPYDETTDKYSDKYKELEQRLGVVKNVRQFKQFVETGRKCALNGEYNIKVYRKTFEEEQKSIQQIRKNKLFADDNFIANKSFKAIKQRHLQAGEGLCAISFLKRLYKDKKGEKDEKQNFPSTAKICLLNLYENKDIETEIDAFEKMFEQGNFDEQFILEDTLSQSYFDKYGISYKKEYEVKDILEQQSKIYQIIKEKSKKVSKYYALLRFDGDSMGEWLSKAKDKDEHKAFSKLLIDFAQKAKNYIDTEGGQTVYAGGDDFLGFVNLNYLFETLTYLKASFEAEVTDKVPIQNGNKRFTMSMSVVIAHYKTPLQKVVQLSDKLLKDTKTILKDEDKNGICLTFMKKSGLVGQVMTKNENIDLLKDAFDAIRAEKFNSRFIYTFAETFAHWTGDNTFENSDIHYEMIGSELNRLICKRVSKDNKKAVECLALKLKQKFIYYKDNKINFSNLVNTIRVLEAINAEI